MTTTIAAAPVNLVRKAYATDEINFTPGERSCVSWITTDVVDHEGDVVVAAGVDYQTVFLKNPVVQAFHDYGKWPIGKCEWIKSKRGNGFTGLFAKTVFDDDPDAETVWKKVKGGSVRGVSIGFRPPEDATKSLWGPPTREEIKARPEWATARRIIRRCVLLEYSIVPIPMNPTALIEAVAKGLHKPSYGGLAMSGEKKPDVVEATEVEENTEAEADAATLPIPEAEDPEPGPDPDTTKAYDPDDDGDDDSDEHPEPELPVRKGHFARVVKGNHKGFIGKVVSVHRNEFVPDVDEHVKGTKAEPAARINCYRKMSDGHVPTDHHIGVKMMHLEKSDDLAPPKKKTAKGVPHASIGVEILPHEIRTDAEILAERRERQKALLPLMAKQIVRELVDELTGAV